MLERYVGALGARIIAGLLAIAALALLLSLTLCHRARQHKAAAQVSGRQADAAIASGSDAVATIGNVEAAHATTQQTVKEAQDAIANAPAGSSDDSAVRAMCGMRSYRDTPRCRALLGAGTR